MTKVEVRAMCKQNPQKWEKVLKDCLDDTAWDDIERLSKKHNWKLPLDSYLYNCSLIRGHVIEMCQGNPKMLESVARAFLADIPEDFVDYLSEENGWAN